MKFVFEGLLPEDRPQSSIQPTQPIITRAPKKSRVQLRMINANVPLFHAL